MSEPQREPEFGRPDRLRRPDVLARELGGSMPCARCGYDLRGLSVRSSCSECGLPVRATLRLKVDPLARELRPIQSPRATAAGVLVWVWAGLLAAVCVWVMRGADLGAMLGVTPRWLWWLAGHAPGASAVLVLLSGFGAIALIRPHDGIPRWQSVCAVCGVAACGALAALMWRIHVVHDNSNTAPYLTAESWGRMRPMLRLVANALVAAILLLLRPNARLLVARSMLLRTGKVDRQTMLAIAACAAVVSVGDATHLAALHVGEGPAELVRLIGTAFIGIGSLLLTLGLIGMVVDTHRIVGVIVSPPLSLGDVLVKGVRSAPR